MAKTKEQKKKTLEQLTEDVKKQKVLMFVDFAGLKVKDMLSLRKSLKEVKSKLKVAKKTIIKLALKGTGLEKEVKGLQGELALVIGFDDGLSSAKAVYNFSKENPNLKILGGFFENKYREAEEFIVLAQLPSKKELLARFLGSISSPASNFVRALNYNVKGLILALNAIKDSKK